MARKGKGQASAPTGVTAEEIKTKRIAEAAAKRKAALEQLAECQQIEAELGIGGSAEEETVEIAPEAVAPSKLDLVISEIEDDGTFEIYRKTGGVEAKLGRWPMSEYPEEVERTAHRVGGGDLKVVFKRSNGTIAATKLHTFDPEAYKRTDQPAQAQGGAASDFAKMLEVIQTKEERMREREMQMQERMLQMQKDMITATQAANPFKSIADIKALMSMMEGDKKGPLDQIKDVLEIVSTLKSDGAQVMEEVSPMQAALNKAFDLLKPLAEGWAKKVLLAQPTRPASAPPKPTPPVALPPASNAPAEAARPSVPAEPESPNTLSLEDLKAKDPAITDGERAMLANYGQQLLGICTAGMPADTAAFEASKSLEESNIVAIKSLVDDPYITAKLLAVTPALAQHQKWIATFILEMQEYVKDFLEVPEEPASVAPEPVAETEAAEGSA